MTKQMLTLHFAWKFNLMIASCLSGPDGQHQHRSRIHQLPPGAGDGEEGRQSLRGGGAGGGEAGRHPVPQGPPHQAAGPQVQVCGGRQT